ncbi:winged helix-turn-helix transcriptional regulator [Planktothrix pseudagardhii]|nr:helix-turn-helix domain-containing protein [Planktothrix pseudagardhii]
MNVTPCLEKPDFGSASSQNQNTCPIQYIVQIISSKWSVSILRELLIRNCRTHEFLEALPGISTKTLTIRLRELEKYGIIERKVYAEIPPHVEYSLTDKGRQLQPVLIALKQAGEQLLQQEPCHCSIKL